MSTAFLNLVKAELFRRGPRVTEAGVDRLLRQAQDEFKVDRAERAWLQELAAQDVFDTPAAKAKLQAALAAFPALPDFRDQVSGLVEGGFASHMNDDELFLGKDGVVEWNTGRQPFSRSYLPISEGPLRHRHGSAAPATAALTPAELSAARSRTPGQALNAAAARAGVSLPDLDGLFNSRRFYNPSAASWEGSCHAWTPLSLHPRLSSLVDVDGPEGARGVWYGDEFFSRAELGNLAMALGDTITNSPATREMGDNFVNALDVLKACQLYLGNRKAGFQADVWNDVARGDAQVWNQPFSRAAMEAKTLDGPAARALLDLAASDFAVADKSSLAAGAARVKQVRLTGTYGKEVADDWEGRPASESATWNLYVVVDGDGRALVAYNANDARLKALPVPTRESAELPDFIVKPDLSFVDDAFSGRPNAVIDRDPNGKAFRFLVGEVLGRGVPAATRAAFERDVAALPAGRVTATAAAELARRYPGVATAFGAESWARAFGARGLDRAAFGG